MVLGKMKSLGAMALEDCHSLLMVVLLRGAKGRHAHLVNLRKARLVKEMQGTTCLQPSEKNRFTEVDTQAVRSALPQ